MMTDDLKPPGATKGDAAHAAARSMLSAIPLAGGAAVEIFNALVVPPLERRRDEWREEVADAICRLQEEGCAQAEKLREDPVFIDTLLQATQVALRSSQGEKRRALRNAVLNAALPSAPDQAVQQIFLSYIDVFTVWHLRLLDLFENPRSWAQRNGRPLPNLYSGGLSAIVDAAFPDLRGNREFYDQVWRDLYLRGLVNTEGLNAMMTGEGLGQSRTTAAGNAFLAFIREPGQEHAS